MPPLKGLKFEIESTQHSASPVREKVANGDPAACWAIMTPSRVAGLDCRYFELAGRTTHSAGDTRMPTESV